MRHREALGGDSGAFGIRFELVLLRSGTSFRAQVDLGGAITVGEKAVRAECDGNRRAVCAGESDE
ncbi:hypothetical protein NKH85_31775 [Mesorhizobium sp. M0924]|uniref:hypothetical protein n=1 Tax=unclassified Mesorhizobium TaxID=325217 RepID=UPI0033378261